MRLKLILILAGLGLSGVCLAQLPEQLDSARRHVVVLQSSHDTLWGSYFYAIENRSMEAVKAKVPVMMPQEMEDFRAQSGAESEEIVLGKGGSGTNSVSIDKEWTPGNHLVAFSYKVPASFGAASLTLNVPYDVEQVMLMAPQGTLKLAAEGMESKSGEQFAGQVFDAVFANDVKGGTILRVAIEGVPEGRARFWLIGSAVALILVILGGIFAMKTRPRIQELEGAVIEI